MNDQKPSISDVQPSHLDVNKLPRAAISKRGMPMGRNVRLPSIRTPRDLTLVGTPKRTFVPNIPVRRDKKPLLTENSAENPKTAEPKNRSPNVKVNQRGKFRKEYVQLPGTVFGEGVKASPRANAKVENQIRTSKPPVSRQTRSSSSLPDTSTIVKKERTSDADDTSSDGYEDDNYDYDREDSDYEPPVCLPLKVDPDLKAKEEKGSKAGWNHEFIKHCCKTSYNTTPNDIQDLFFNSNGAFEDQLMFFEFPDTILHAVRNRELNETPQRGSVPGTSRESPSNIQSSNEAPPSWNQAVEGYIGKLQLLRNGKVRLAIGDYILDDLELFESSPVLQQLTSLSGNQTNPDMTVLGQIRHKVRFMADVHCLAKVSVS